MPPRFEMVIELIDQTFLRGAVEINHDVPAEDEVQWGFCRIHLAALCGTPGMAIKIARLGISSGLYGLFRGIAQRMVEEHTKNQIGAAVTDFWNALSAEELIVFDSALNPVTRSVTVAESS